MAACWGRMKSKYLCALAAALLTVSAQAATTVNGVTLAPISGLGSGSSYASWTDMSSQSISGTGTFFTATNPWAGPVASQSNVNDSSTALIKKANGSSGAPYAASASMYYSGMSDVVNNNGGTLALTTSNPLAGLQTVIFQIQIGEAWGYDLYNDALPALSYSVGGNSFSLSASGSSVYDKFNNGTVPMPTGDEDVYINTYAVWFDLSGVAGAIESFEVSWTGVQHAQIYGLAIQQGSEAVTASILPPAAIPEPSALLLGSVGLLFLFRRRK